MLDFKLMSYCRCFSDSIQEEVCSTNNYRSFDFTIEPESNSSKILLTQMFSKASSQLRRKVKKDAREMGSNQSCKRSAQDQCYRFNSGTFLESFPLLIGEVIHQKKNHSLYHYSLQNHCLTNARISNILPIVR